MSDGIFIKVHVYSFGIFIRPLFFSQTSLSIIIIDNDQISIVEYRI
jgi:hypothetical protein